MKMTGDSRASGIPSLKVFCSVTKIFSNGLFYLDYFYPVLTNYYLLIISAVVVVVKIH